MLAFLLKLDKALGAGLRWFSIICLVILAVVLSGVVLVRYMPIAKLSWSDEVVSWAFAWMVFLGSAALWRLNDHFCVDALSCALQKRRGGRLHKLLVESLCLVFFCLFTYYGYQLTIKANDRSPILEWPKPLWYACMPIAGAIMAGYSLKTIVGLVIEMIAPGKLAQSLNRRKMPPGKENQAA